VVQDSGPGLSDADLARLGDRFFRVAANGADGSGLGWSIVRRLAQRYRLHVLVERSVELGGLRVVVTWPEV
jgi:two-component system sensor histidine kinase QseC